MEDTSSLAAGSGLKCSALHRAFGASVRQSGFWRVRNIPLQDGFRGSHREPLLFVYFFCPVMVYSMNNTEKWRY